MPARKKNFDSNDRRAKLESTREHQLEVPSGYKVMLPRNDVSVESISFERYWGRGIDQVISMFVWSANNYIDTKARAVRSVISYGRSFKYLLEFCIDMGISRVPANPSLMDDFIFWLSRYVTTDGSPFKVTTQKTIYSHCKTVIGNLIELKLVERFEFPRNPYPGVNNHHEGEKPYSETERRLLVKALKVELRTILLGRTDKTQRYQISVLAVIIGLRTGINLTPLIEMSASPYEDHPLRKDIKLLYCEKRRGGVTSPVSIPNSRNTDEGSLIEADAVALIDWVRNFTSDARRVAVPEINERLFLFVDMSRSGYGTVGCLNGSAIEFAAKELVQKYNLVDDEGAPLIINISKLRVSFINKLYEITRDPAVVATLARNSPRVTADVYLAVTEDMKRNFMFAGRVMFEALSGSTDSSSSGPIMATPLSGCSDPIKGQFAPKNGAYCDKFLLCFKCKNMVVAKDDLWRLYSFYWLLIKERMTITAPDWERLYGTVVSIIDNAIGPKFDKRIVDEAKEQARVAPHPFWMSREALIARES